MNDFEKAKNILEEKKIRPSVVRTKVLEYMITHKTHPGVDDVYRDLVKDIPTLSKTSVYNILKLFCANNIVKEIDIDSTYIRYDGNVNFHGHFKCNQCLSVYDFDVDEPKYVPAGFKVISKEVYYYGICNNCTDK